MKRAHPTRPQPIRLASGPLRLTRGLPLILTKLVPPRSPGELLRRPRLLERLDPVRLRRLALVSAGAGFGKTTLLAQWHHCLAEQGERVAWLSLDEDDDSPWQFIPYLLQALRPLHQDWDPGFWQRLEQHTPTSPQQLLAELINQLHDCPHDLFLIIDDFHVIDDRGVHDALGYLLAHAPPALHLIIGSRFRPRLALSRLQAEDQLVEVGDQELRFTLEEARGYFNETLAVPLSGQDTQRLLSLTEGWIAGMKIASLSPGLRDDPARLIDNLRGGTRAITRYLKEVVFDPLPVEVFDFLLRTSILGRLNAGLCNAVTERDDGEAMLEWIERHNLFLSALDEHGAWFRYHPLLRETLGNRLRRCAGIDIKQLHERASGWFVEQRLWAEAVRHALVAGKPIGSPGQDGASAQSLAEEGDIDTLVRWMHHLPVSLDPSRIDLQLNLAWALAHYFRFDEARQLLDNLDQLVAGHRAGLRRSTWVKLRVVRAICEAFSENIAESLALVEPLLQEVPCGDTWVDGLVCNILSYCHVVEQRYAEALAVQRHMPGPDAPLGNLFVSVYRAFIIAQCHLCQGDLDAAERHARQALLQAERYTGAQSSSSATLAPLLAEIAYERGEHDQLAPLLADKLDQIDRFSPPDGLRRCYVSLARQALCNGAPHQAERLLEHALQLAIARRWRRLQALLLAEQARVRLLQGDYPAAEQLQQQLERLAPLARIDAEHPCQRAIAQHALLGRSRLLLAAGQAAQAAKLLGRLVAEQESRHDWLAAARLRVLWARALWQADESDKACTALQPALRLAGRQRLERSLLDAGDELLPLLSRLQKKLPARHETGEILARLLERHPQADERQRQGHTTRQGLSERECQALRLVAEGQSNKEIARSLDISTETVKWHLKNIYGKLNVTSRTQAIGRAQELGLLE
ncbi:LuxR C-terminal-related transcriptional regulator [Stutzerimonas kirkiae]|uniref:LuxR C-terminal-related transcriptional regulator n=1 Tax=Stutzerimonas kirkiae TaxID=2211392 RepID=UPI001038495D|nr:LuxR C-terminal-related transcriptional regulator [Stutzerimonas kirkiae]TBV06599.1 helix-turn-helix transcriptional regulator [Stutzerimonas kirkiae]